MDWVMKKWRAVVNAVMTFFVSSKRLDLNSLAMLLSQGEIRLMQTTGTVGSILKFIKFTKDRSSILGYYAVMFGKWRLLTNPHGVTFGRLTFQNTADRTSNLIVLQNFCD